MIFVHLLLFLSFFLTACCLGKINVSNNLLNYSVNLRNGPSTVLFCMLKLRRTFCYCDLFCLQINRSIKNVLFTTRNNISQKYFRPYNVTDMLFSSSIKQVKVKLDGVIDDVTGFNINTNNLFHSLFKQFVSPNP